MSWFNPKFLLTDLGFDGPIDLLTSSLGFKGNIFAPIAFIFAGGLSLFIERNAWSNPTEVYFLAMLIAIDLFTGIWKSIKTVDPEKKFRSRKITRTVGKITTYSLLLYISFNLDKNMSEVFFWMPYSVLGVFYATETWSIIENLAELGYLNKEFVKFLKKKLSITNFLKQIPENKESVSVRPLEKNDDLPTEPSSDGPSDADNI